MVGEVLVGLNCRSGRLYVDGTVGGGGHAAAILDRIGPEGELWGLDRDPNALQAAATRLAHHTSNFQLFQSSYAQLGELLEAARLPGVAGILLDLGLSSLQLQESQRGFSFSGDEPLDMRFNPEEPGRTAATLLNRASKRSWKGFSGSMARSIGPGASPAWWWKNAAGAPSRRPGSW